MAAPRLNKTKRAIVNTAIRHILAKPGHFDMNDWLRPERGREGAACGTVGCLAGHIALAAGYPARNESTHGTYLQHAPDYVPARTLPRHIQKMVEDPSWNVSPSDIAEHVLGCDEGGGVTLFHVEYWPDQFRKGFYRLKRMDKARVAVKRLRYYLRTGL